VFLLLDTVGRPVGAELRGTTRLGWRGMAPGSRKDHGFFSVPAPTTRSIVLSESAIDAISCHANSSAEKSESLTSHESFVGLRGFSLLRRLIAQVPRVIYGGSLLGTQTLLLGKEILWVSCRKGHARWHTGYFS
jgi:hypothetical protein